MFELVGVVSELPEDVVEAGKGTAPRADGDAKLGTGDKSPPRFVDAGARIEFSTGLEPDTEIVSLAETAEGDADPEAVIGMEVAGAKSLRSAEEGVRLVPEAMDALPPIEPPLFENEDASPGN